MPGVSAIFSTQSRCCSGSHADVFPEPDVLLQSACGPPRPPRQWSAAVRWQRSGLFPSSRGGATEPGRGSQPGYRPRALSGLERAKDASELRRARSPKPSGHFGTLPALGCPARPAGSGAQAPELPSEPLLHPVRLLWLRQLALADDLLEAVRQGQTPVERLSLARCLGSVRMRPSLFLVRSGAYPPGVRQGSHPHV